MSFFSSGAVDVKQFDRSRLVEGTYRVALVDAADHLGAHSGNRTQFDFRVVKGPQAIGLKRGEIVGHTYDASWKAEKARGNILAILGAFSGKTRDESGLIKDPVKFVKENTRTLQYANGGKEVASMTRGASDLPLVKQGAEAILVVKAHFDRKTGQRKKNPKTGQPSVIYEFYPLSCGFVPDELGSSPVAADEEDDAPPAPETATPAVDALELAFADGWKPNGTTGWFYKKGEAAQHKEPALRAMYGGAQ